MAPQTCSSSARPARARAPRRRGSRPRSACRTSRPATCCARTCATARSSAQRAKAFMDAGELVPDSLVIEMLEATASRSPTPPAGSCSTASRATSPRPRRSTPSSPRRGRSIGALLVLDVPEEEVVRRISGRLVCPNGHTFHETANPPADARRLRRLRRRRSPAAPTTSPTSCAAATATSTSRRPSPCAATTAPRGVPELAVDGVGTTRRGLRAPAARARRLVIERKSSREIAKQAQAGAIVAETLAICATTAQPGRDDRASSTASPSATSAGAAARRRSRATAASPARSARRRTT